MRFSTQMSYDVRPVLSDLYQPARRDPNGIPHLLGGSQDPASLEPERHSDGTRNIGRVAGWLNAPPGRPPGRVSRLTWHCIVQADPADPPLSDSQWRRVASDIMARSHEGRAERRWIAVRHGRAHIHVLAAVHRGAHPAPGLLAVQAACRAAAARYHLKTARRPVSMTTRMLTARTLASEGFPAARCLPAPPDSGSEGARLPGQTALAMPAACTSGYRP
jgi:hypothetical protein